MSSTSLAFSPLLPWVVLGALAAASALILALGVWRRAPGTGWRTLAVAGVLLALANPALVAEERQPLADIAVVVVDESASQRIGERGARTAAALKAIEERLGDRPDLELRVLRVGPGAAAAGGPVEGTRLFAALEAVLADVPRQRFAGAILLTDGQVHDAPEAAGALSFEAPLHALISGERDAGDRRLTVVEAPSFGLVDQSVKLLIRIDDPAGSGVREARVTVRRNGAAGSGDTPAGDLRRQRSRVNPTSRESLEEARERIRRSGVDDVGEFVVPVGQERSLEVVLDRGGPSVFEIAVEAGPAELTLDNNRAVVVVNGVRDRLRVLLVSGEPHPGERTWRNLLKADPSVDLVHFTILRPPEKQDGTPVRELSLIAFPIRELFEIRLDDFDLIVFDRYRRRGVLPQLYLSNIADYVAGGGAFLEAVGPSFASPLSLYRTPLGTVLPGEPTGRILEERFQAAVTDIGRRHPVTAGLAGAGPADEAPSWGAWFRQIEVEPRSGSVLMDGARARPLLQLDRVGDGRVAQLTTDHMWLWARGYDGGGPQAELLRRLAHWLMKEPELEEDNLTAEVRAGRLEIQRRSVTPETAAVTVTTPSGATVEVALEETGDGRAAGAIEVTEAGLYRLTDGRRTTLAAAGALNPLEFADVTATDLPLRQLARATGGGIVWLADGNRMPDIRLVAAGRDTFGTAAGGRRPWLGLRKNDDYVVTGVTELRLLPGLMILLLALGTLLLAWRREGQ